MKCSGDGLLYLADYGANVVVVNLGGDAISVNATNLLAFDASLQWGVERVKGLAKFAGQGLWNTKISGQGWVALTSRGEPIVVDCGSGEDETYVDPDALVAWSPNLKVKGKRSFKAQSLIGRGQRRGVPDGLLRPGHRRRAAQRGQHRPPADPRLRGRGRHHAEPAFRLQRRPDAGALEPAEQADAPRHPGGPRRRPRPQAPWSPTRA